MAMMLTDGKEAEPLLLYKNNENYDLVDALPYIDPLGTDVRAVVKSMIDEEMLTMKKDVMSYLDPLPLPETPNLDSDPFILGEIERIAAQRPSQKLDTSRYQVEAPTGVKANDVGEWRKAVENAQAQLEHSFLRAVNLQLNLDFGPKVWQRGAGELQTLQNFMSQRVAALKREVEEVNKKRKLEQISCGNDLRHLTRRWEETVESNQHILEAVAQGESSVATLKSTCIRRGATVPESVHSLGLEADAGDDGGGSEGDASDEDAEEEDEGEEEELQGENGNATASGKDVTMVDD